MLLLNVLMLTIGATATLAAFGGETWLKGNEPILNRITPRGWIALLCLLLGLCLAVIKEIGTSSRDAKKDADFALATKQAALDRANAEIEKTRLLAELDKAQYEIKSANSSLAIVKVHLDDTRRSVTSVSVDLKSARSELADERQKSILSALVSDNRTISEVWAVLPLNPDKMHPLHKVQEGLSEGKPVDLPAVFENALGKRECRPNSRAAVIGSRPEGGGRDLVGELLANGESYPKSTSDGPAMSVIYQRVRPEDYYWTEEPFVVLAKFELGYPHPAGELASRLLRSPLPFFLADDRTCKINPIERVPALFDKGYLVLFFNVESYENRERLAIQIPISAERPQRTTYQGERTIAFHVTSNPEFVTASGADTLLYWMAHPETLRDDDDY